MHYFRLAGLFFGLLLANALLAADAGVPDVSKGEGFVKVIPPQPTQDIDRVEVIEFFWYGCPHCYSFEPHLSKWAKNLPDNVRLIRQPVIFSSKWEAGARAYYIGEALGVIDKIHADFFHALHQQQRRLQTEEQLAEFFAEHGVTRKDFQSAYNSFTVAMHLKQAESMPARYRITGVPAIVINGKYQTGGGLAKTHPGVISVMDQLIEQELAAIGKP